VPDVFNIVDTGGDFFRDAALDAGFELGVLALLRSDGTARTLDDMAHALGVEPARHRLRALLDVLVGIGALARVGEGYGLVENLDRARPERPPSDGWGALAKVIRTNQPLPVPGGGEADTRLHLHLAKAGAPAAAELAALLGSVTVASPGFAGARSTPEGSAESIGGLRHLVDLGGGMGAYTEAFLRAHRDARSTLVDVPAIVTIARPYLESFGTRVAFVPADIRDAQLTNASAALLSNVLHLHGPETCRHLVAHAASVVGPGGLVAIKDLRVDDGRPGPLEGLLFALNMALYTDAGDVYETAQLRTWLTEAGLVDVEERRLETSPNAIVVVGRKP
jgi:hypothetical protein